MDDLFEDAGPQPIREKPVRPCNYEQHAIELLGLPHAWEAYSWRVVGPHGAPVEVEVAGGVFTTMKTRGPSKGRPNYKKPEPGTAMTITLGIKQHQEWRLQWQLETGLCAECQGRGVTLASFGQAGVRYRKCRTCGGTGTYAKQENSP